MLESYTFKNSIAKEHLPQIEVWESCDIVKMESEDPLVKAILAKLYLYSLRNGQFGENLDDSTRAGDLLKTFNLPNSLLLDSLARMRKQNLIRSTVSKAHELTADGRGRLTVVMAGGSFDIIHPGHIETLRNAKALGDVLVVSVARDSTYIRNKHKEPTHDEKSRRELVSSVKYVDAAVLGSERDIFETVKFLEPDVIALGYDQAHSETSIKEGAKRAGIDVNVVRLDSVVPEIKTSKILTSGAKDQLLRET